MITVEAKKVGAQAKAPRLPPAFESHVDRLGP